MVCSRRWFWLVGVSATLLTLPRAWGANGLKDMDRLPEPGKNFVRHGDFEMPGAKVWFQARDVAPDAATRVSGEHSLRAKGSQTRETRSRQDVPLVVGETYTLSAWMKSRDLLRRSDDKGPASGVSVVDGGWYWRAYITPDAATSDWKRYSITFKAPPADKRKIAPQLFYVNVYTPTGETGEIWVDNIQIERGGKATQFTAKAIPDYRRIKKMIRETSPLCEAVSASLKKLRHADGLIPLTKQTQSVRAKLDKAADQVRSFAVVPDEEWQWTVRNVETAREEVGASLWRTWWTTPWARFDRRQSPPSMEQAGPVRLKMAVNDYMPLALMITNLGDKALEIQVKLRPKDSPDGRRLAPPPWATLRQARRVAVIAGKAEELPMLLAKLDESHVIKVAPAETTQLWIDVDTQDMSAGTYETMLELWPYQDIARRTIPVTLEVLPIILPKRCPAEVFCFGVSPLETLGERRNNMSQEEVNSVQDPWLRDLVRHGVNRLFNHSQHFRPKFDRDGSLAKPLDFTWHDRFLASKRRYLSKFAGGYSVGYYHFLRGPYGDVHNRSVDPDVYRARFTSFMKAWTDHLRELGFGPDDFPMELFDEPKLEILELITVAREALREAAPDWKTMAPITLTQPHHIKKFLPIVDIVVVTPDIPAQSAKLLRDSGKTIWTYRCSGLIMNEDPYDYYRLTPWKTWAKGFSGFGFTWCTYGIDKGSPRQLLESQFYYGTNGPIPSRGWQAFWRGTRDWTYLHVLREAIKRARENNRVKEADESEKLLNGAVKQVLEKASSKTEADRWRVRLLDQITALQ